MYQYALTTLDDQIPHYHIEIRVELCRGLPRTTYYGPNSFWRGVMPFTEQEVATSLQEVHSLLFQWTSSLYGASP